MKNPLKELSSISAPWSFVQWGVDIMGPLPVGKGGCKFLAMTVVLFLKDFGLNVVTHFHRSPIINHFISLKKTYILWDMNSNSGVKPPYTLGCYMIGFRHHRNEVIVHIICFFPIPTLIGAMLMLATHKAINFFLLFWHLMFGPFFLELS
jgi:hypothetical protein